VEVLKYKQGLNTGSSLVAVIIITSVSIAVIGAMVVIVSIVMLDTLGWQKSAEAMLSAESYADDHILKTIRNPNLEIENGSQVELLGSTIRPVLFKGLQGKKNVLFINSTKGSYTRTLRLVYTLTNGELVVIDRSESDK
jgi:hypothetical protein